MPDRAEELAAAFGARARSLDAVLHDPDIDAIVNLTPPLAHAAVSRAALDAGQGDVQREAARRRARRRARRSCELARERGACASVARPTRSSAPDCRLRVRSIDRGDIGEPLAANAFMLGSGPERWHPSPAIFYQHGAGPALRHGPVLPHHARATARAGARA